MKEYLSQWTYKRVLQLGVGIYFFWEYNNHPSTFAVVFGSIMTFQAIANVGCFSTRGCNPNIDQKAKDNFSENDDVEFEEVEEENNN